MTSASDGLARVWSDKGELKSVFNCSTEMVMVSKWNKDGTLIASADGEKRIHVWLPQET